MKAISPQGPGCSAKAWASSARSFISPRQPPSPRSAPIENGVAIATTPKSACCSKTLRGSSLPLPSSGRPCEDPLKGASFLWWHGLGGSKCSGPFCARSRRATPHPRRAATTSTELCRVGKAGSAQRALPAEAGGPLRSDLGSGVGSGRPGAIVARLARDAAGGRRPRCAGSGCRRRRR